VHISLRIDRFYSNLGPDGSNAECTRSTLAQYAGLIHRNGGGGSDPVLGALQLFQNNVITQSRLLSYIDIYFGLAALGVVALISIAFTRLKPKLGPRRFHPW
jgi:MFS transporter, DHA2 family, multidrug resistance protein